MIDLTDYTINTDPETDLDALDITYAAYNELPHVADWTINHGGSITLHHDNGEDFAFGLEDTDGTVDGYTYTIYDTEGDDYTTDGGNIDSVDDLDGLVDEITRWAAK